MYNKVFNADKEEIEDREYNVFIGISIGALKSMDEELATKYISWALERTKDEVAILIADEIGKINYEVFSSYSPGKAKNRALRYGEEYEEFFQETLESNFSAEDREKVNILHWKDIFDKRKEDMKKVLDEEYNSNDKFSEKILSFVKAYVSTREKEVTEEELDYLAEYILYELPILLDGISYKGTKYDLLLYPTYTHSGMSRLSTDLQKGEVFPHLKKEMGLEGDVAMVEMYLPE